MRFSAVVMMVVGAFSIGLGGCVGDGAEDATEDVGTAVAANFAVGPPVHGFVMDDADLGEQVGTVAAEMDWDGPPVTGFVMDEAVLDEQAGTAAAAVAGGSSPSRAPVSKRSARGSR
jgi:hypothetical protein